MRRSRQRFSLLFPLALIAASGVARAADILQQVPSDALGFVLIHNVASVDAKVGQLASMLQRTLPRPLAFLKDVTGISEGINPQGDFLLALFPAADDNASQPPFCVWLPVTDYDRFIQSLGAKPGGGVTAVTIAGEDLLVARHGDWALMMDPDQRERMAKLLAAPPSPPPQIAAWRTWIDGNNVTAIALPSGVKAVLAWLVEDGAGATPESSLGGADDDVFGPADSKAQDVVVAPRSAARNNLLAKLKTELQQWAAASPDLLRTILQAHAIGCGIRLDQSNNAIAGLRIALDNNFDDKPNDGSVVSTSKRPPTLYERGGFVLNGAGRLPKRAAVMLASAYTRRLMIDLEREEHIQADEAAIVALQRAVEEAMGDIRSASVLTQPGDTPQAVYTNNFVTLDVDSLDNFVDHSNEVMRLWNKAIGDANRDAELVFEVQDVKLGQRNAKQYSLDFAAIHATPAVPEIRQAMEKFFGPGGKLRLWIVPVDTHTVLLAIATPEQVTAALKMLDRKQPINWGFTATNNLLDQGEWRLFFDPHGYFAWLKRETDAEVGVPVIGGPLVKDFPVSPPIGFAGGFRANDLWLDAAVPAEAIKSAGTFLKK